MNCRRGAILCVMLLLVGSSRAVADAQGGPKILDGVRIDQNLGATVPLDAVFRDEAGREVRLGEYFGRRPVVLTLVYYKCPGLCTTVLNDVSRSLNGLTESAGSEFEVVTVSFDPRETPELAAARKAQYLRGYQRPTAAAGWHFLTGPQTSIEALAGAVGFHYRWDEANELWAHAAATIVVTPEGKISRYFYGVEAPPTDLHHAILQASDGAVGRPAERVLLYCFRYDPTTGRWGLIISRMLQVLGGVTVLLVGRMVWWQVSHNSRVLPPGGAERGTPCP